MCRTQCMLVLVNLYVGLGQSWDIAIAKRDLLEFYVNNTKTDTVRFKFQNLAALVYDEVHNMMLYVDKQSDNDAICGYNMSSMQYKYLTERNGRNIRGLAFDPVTELLFFTDTTDKSINWISLKLGVKNNVYGNILIKIDDGIPTDIAVDSCRGFIYWIKSNRTTPTIERARFNGSEREVVTNSTLLSINTTYKLEPHSLAIDEQTKKMYWIESESSSGYHIISANLNGKNKKILGDYKYWYINGDDTRFANISNTLAVSKDSLFMMGWCPTCSVWKFPKTVITHDEYHKSLFPFYKEIPASIAANYKNEEKIQGIYDCKALSSLVLSDTLKTATEYMGDFCVHGKKVNGEFICKCTSGYIGERCDVSLCVNYCIKGNCSFNDDGLPKCRCEAGYSGERCEVNACHSYCLNNGECSLNEESQPVCQCVGNYGGPRCEAAKNYNVTNRTLDNSYLAGRTKNLYNMVQKYFT